MKTKFSPEQATQMPEFLQAFQIAQDYLGGGGEEYEPQQSESSEGSHEFSPYSHTRPQDGHTQRENQEQTKKLNLKYKNVFDTVFK